MSDHTEADQTDAAQRMRLEIGMPIDSTDEHWGSLHDVVIDPRHWKVTHLVVKPRFHHHGHWLVPIETVAACDRRITLSLSDEEIVNCPQVEVTDFVQVGPAAWQDTNWTIGTPGMLAWPYYPAALADGSSGQGFTYGRGDTYGPAQSAIVTTKYDQLPSGTVEIRRASKVITFDDHEVGSVDGFVIAGDGGITHLVLEKGHFWGHREVAIPLADVIDATASLVRLSATRAEVGEYPELEVRRHHGVHHA